jgi:hypothetical protein
MWKQRRPVRSFNPIDAPATPREQPHRESAVVRRLRRVTVWSVLAGVVVFAMMFGLRAGVVAAAVFAATYKGIEGAFGQRIKERFERQPDLRLAVAHDGEFVDTVASSILPPWPFDADRVVAHEVKRLEEEAAGIEMLARKGPAVLLPATDPFARRPSDEAYQQAREQFADKLDEHAHALRAWLAEYREAADERAHTLELSLSVISAKSGAYAEDVVLTIDLPEGIEVLEEPPTVSPPPEPPAYVAPQPRSAFDIPRPSYAGIDLRALAPVIPTVPMPDVSFWQTRSDGGRVLRRLGNVHHDSTVEVDGRLLLRVPADGRHTLTWTLRTKNGRRHRTGTLEVVVPPTEQRPPFTRLQGIESYPDIPFVDEEGQLVREARTSDPPTEPPAQSSADEPLGRLHDVVACREWLALGLGDDADHREDDEVDLDLDVIDEAASEGDAA